MATTKQYTRADVAEHNSYDDAWLIIDDKVYDVTNFVEKHPGGKVILYYRGQDATEPFQALHCNLDSPNKYLKAYCIGELTPEDKPTTKIVKEFREFRKQLEDEGMFKPKPDFFLLHLVSIILMEVMAVVSFSYTGSWLLCAVLLATAQQQAGWLQHDFGHAAVFNSFTLNQWAHYFLIGFMKGASSWWWKCKHTRHHAKTNIITRDPDMHVEPLFSFNDTMTKERFTKYLPILNLQASYWYLIGPPLTTTLLFVYQNMVFMARYAVLEDMILTLLFYVRFELMFRNYLSGWGILGMYFLMRFIESHWFTWVTSMSHLPMPIIKDQDIDWLTMQVNGTQNVEDGYFNNWFTGHLNFQIEHHLFPTMPRHNYPLVAPRLRALAERNGLVYHERTLWQSFVDIVDTLKRCAVTFSHEKEMRAQKKAAAAS